MNKFLSLFFALTMFAQVHAIGPYTIPDYSLEAAGTGVQGTYLVRVWVMTRMKSVDDVDFKKAAVHGVIFRGIPGAGSAPSQHPFTQAADEQQKREYYDKFFSSTFLQFAEVVPASYAREKVGKGYRIGAVVLVQKDDLRRELEKAGVIKPLASGF